MNTAEREAFDYCAEIVRTGDEDSWLAAQYAPPPQRRTLMAVYALAAEIERIPGAVSEPPLGEIRLQWWREALDEIMEGKTPRAHPVVQAVAVANVLTETIRGLFDEAINARARLLYAEPFMSIDEFCEWIARADGAAHSAAAFALSPTAGDIGEALADAAVAFGLARKGARLAPALEKNDLDQRVENLLRRSRAALNRAGDVALPALLPLALTRLYLRSKKEPSGAAKRWRLFIAMAAGRL